MLQLHPCLWVIWKAFSWNLSHYVQSTSPTPSASGATPQAVPSACLLACMHARLLGKHLCIQQRPTGSCRLCERREKVPSQNPEAGFGSKPQNSMILCYFIYLLIFNFGGHTQWCSAITPERGSGGARFQTWVATCKACTLPDILSL